MDTVPALGQARTESETQEVELLVLVPFPPLAILALYSAHAPRSTRRLVPQSSIQLRPALPISDRDVNHQKSALLHPQSWSRHVGQRGGGSRHLVCSLEQLTQSIPLALDERPTSAFGHLNRETLIGETDTELVQVDRDLEIRIGFHRGSETAPVR